MPIIKSYHSEVDLLIEYIRREEALNYNHIAYLTNIFDYWKLAHILCSKIEFRLKISKNFLKLFFNCSVYKLFCKCITYD